MAASSPALSNNAADAHTAASAVTFHRTDTPPKTLRGLNKPKCIQCGNVARSRYCNLVRSMLVLFVILQEEPEFCARINHARVAAQKRKIHAIFTLFEVSYSQFFPTIFHCIELALVGSCLWRVLKANATFPDKTPTTSTPVLEQKSTDVSPVGTWGHGVSIEMFELLPLEQNEVHMKNSMLNSLRLASLRQLSNNFAQFSNVQMPLRSRKPLTRKDAAAINEWRFSKLKEYKDRNIEVENEAFDRYMQNISLLEEVFSVQSVLEGSNEDETSVSNPNNTSVKEDSETMISGLELRSNPTRSENFRKRIQQIVDQGLEKLKKCELNDEGNDLNDQNEHERSPKKAKLWWSERSSALSDIIEKLNKARNEEDPKSYLKLKSQLYNLHPRSSQSETEDVMVSKEKTEKNDSTSSKKSSYNLPKLFTTTDIDRETLYSVDTHFSSLEKIEDL
ncbi:hypothetical protein JRO89_XS13G0072100 [Xanthoceras sorbifolium]|uniref:Uncharacterized protein n=1 Tax=Xanthoceras sorbifolium TaxID=99658 RepID=A0ABQ8H727_9ROSI|nr:hypothetical protein JRO89_XS13G0072100 [Xanthoceras sorbifolium]